MFHLSTECGLEGLWIPRQPKGGNTDGEGCIENLPPRVCVAPTLLQCAQALYPNIWEELERVGQMIMNIYKPSRKPDGYTGDIMHTVFDAHITGECIFTSPVEMKHVGKCVIHNPKENQFKELMFRSRIIHIPMDFGVAFLP